MRLFIVLFSVLCTVYVALAATSIVEVAFLQDSAVDVSGCDGNSPISCNMRSAFAYCATVLTQSIDTCSIHLPWRAMMYVDVATYGTLDISVAIGQLHIYGNESTIYPTSNVEIASDTPTLSIHNTGSQFFLAMTNLTWSGLGGGVVHGGVLSLKSTSNIILESIKFIYNKGLQGAAVYAQSTFNVQVVNCSFLQNSASSSGGAVYLASQCTDWAMNDSIFTHNDAVQHGTLYIAASNSRITLENSLLDYNIVGGTGGGLFVASYCTSVVLRYCSMSHNTASNGGSIYVDKSASLINIVDTALVGNKATSNGGGMYLMDSSNQITVTGVSFLDNRADFGAAVYVNNYLNTLKFVNTSFVSNFARINGGAVYMQQYSSTSSFATCRFINNTGQAGAAIYSFQGNNYLTVTDCVFSSQNGGNGGAVYIGDYHNSWTISRCHFLDNSATVGAAMYLNSGNNYIDILDSSFHRNVAQFGGGLTLYGMNYNVHIMSCSFVDNVGTSGGGAVSLGTYSSYIDIVNSTFVANYAGFTGGAFSASDAVYFISFVGCNFTDNGSGRFGGAIYLADNSNTIDVEECIFSGNVASSNGGERLASLRISINDVKLVAGGIYLSHLVSNFLVRGSKFIRNSATNGGGLFLDSQNMLNSVTSSVFDSNRATTAGGAICLKDTNFMFTIAACKFRQNIANSYGGAVSLRSNNQAVTIADTCFLGNSARLAGGGLHASLSNYNTLLESSHMSNNKAPFGGGAFWGEDHINITIRDTNMTANVAQEGGAVYVSQFISHFFVTGSYFSLNKALRGGAIVLKADNVDVSNSTFTLNEATQDGGGIVVNSDYVTISSSVFANNSAAQSGAGLHAEYSKYINITSSVWTNGYASTGSGISVVDSQNVYTDNCRYSSNRAKNGGTLSLSQSEIIILSGDMFVNNTGSMGGAVYCRTISELVITANRYIGNHATISGGGVYLSDLDAAFILESIFMDNIAQYSAGSALWVSASELSVFNSSFDGNKAANGAGTVFWQHNSDMVEPHGLLSNAFHATNKARYGPKAATEGVHVVVAQGSDMNVTNYDKPIPTMSVLLWDYYDQVVTTESEAVVKVSVPDEYAQAGACFDGSGYVTGGTVQTMLDGVANLSALEAYCAPGYSMMLSITCEVSSSLSAPTSVMDVAVQLQFRDCIGGEVYNSKMCRECVNGTYTLADNSDLTLTSCKKCPSRAKSCRGDQIELKRGYWRIHPLSSAVMACPLGPGSCSGGWETGSELCADGHGGVLCAVCSDGYHLSSSTGMCERCAQSAWSDPFLLCVLIVVLGGVGLGVLTASQRGKGTHQDILATLLSKLKLLIPGDKNLSNEQYKSVLLHRKKRVQARFKISLIAYQIVTSMPFVLEFHFPRDYASMLSVFGVLNLAMSQSAVVGCSPIQLDYIDRLLIDTLSPIALLSLLRMVYALHILCMRRKGWGGVMEEETAGSYYLTIAVTFTYVILPGISTSIFRTFSCQNIDPDDSSGGDNWYMRSDYSISCASNRYRFGAAWALVMIVVYPIMIPAAYYLLLRRNKSIILSRHSLVKNPVEEISRTNRLRPLLILCDIYAPHRWYFEVLENCYRVFLTGVLAVIKPGSSDQIIIGALFTLVFVKVYNSSKPFGDRYVGSLKEVSMWQVFAVLFVALMVRSDVIGSSSGSAVALFLLAFFWNIIYEVIRYAGSAGTGQHWASSSTQQLHNRCPPPVEEVEHTLTADELTLRIDRTTGTQNPLEMQFSQGANTEKESIPVKSNGDEDCEGNGLVLSPMSYSTKEHCLTDNEPSS